MIVDMNFNKGEEGRAEMGRGEERGEDRRGEGKGEEGRKGIFWIFKSKENSIHKYSLKELL